jgi:hypothetical protein
MEQFLFIRKWENMEHYYDNIVTITLQIKIFFKKKERKKERMCT